jgi:predicted porin
MTTTLETRHTSLLHYAGSCILTGRSIIRKGVSACAAIALVTMLPAVSRADEVSDLRAQVAAMQKRLNRLEQEKTRKIAAPAGSMPVAASNGSGPIAVPARPVPIVPAGPLPSGLVIPETTYKELTLIPGTDLKIKNPLPDTLTFAGITVWGVIDIGAAAQSAGTPYSSVWWGLNLLPVTASVQNKPQYALIANSTAVSSIGIKIDEPLFGDFRMIGALDTGFNPLTGELDDACKSLQSANGQPSNSLTFGDASRCGQLLNGNAWGGITHPVYGTLTFGRQNPLGAVLLEYDPLAGAGLGLIGWLPSLAGAQGVSEAGKWDNSVKYRYDYGTLFHAQVMYSEGSSGSAIYGHGIGGNIGGTWNGFSIDAQYQQTVDGVINPNAFSTCGTATTPSCSTLDGQAVNATGMGIEAKYVYLFGADPADKAPHDKLTFYGAFDQVTFSDPSFPLSAGIGTVGGYVEGAISNTSFLFGNRIRQLSWGGVRYDTGPWSFELAYYHLNQPFRKTSATSAFCNDASASNCAATSDDVAFMMYYAVNKYVDVYSGVAWNTFSGGLANGEPITQAVTGLSGMRLKF